MNINFLQKKLNSKNWYVASGLFFFTFLIFLSPLVNLSANVDWAIAPFFYLLLAISGAIATFPIKKEYLPILLAIAIVITFAVFGLPVKGAAAALVFYVAFRGVRQSELILFRAFYILLIVNYFLALIQLSGIYELAYSFADYANEADPVSFLKAKVVGAEFLPQIRPSGIFPATSYMSFFCIILYSAVSFFDRRIGNWFMIMTGSFFVLTGSTLGVILICLLAINIFSNIAIAWALLAYVLTLYVYFSVIPEIADYNYSAVDFYNSVINRSLNESILILNPGLLVMIALIFSLMIFYIWMRFNLKVLKIIPVMALIFFPILLHDASSSLLSFFIMGLGVGMLASLIERPTRDSQGVEPNFEAPTGN